MRIKTKLILRFDDDLDGTGQLIVEGSSNDFSGRGAAYFSKSLIEDFANALTSYPLEKENPPEIIGGLGNQENLFLRVYPINGRGDLAIQVKLETELWNEQRLESKHSVQLEILTHYQPLAEFAKELKDLISGRVEEATLKNIQ